MDLLAKLDFLDCIHVSLVPEAACPHLRSSLLCFNRWLFLVWMPAYSCPGMSTLFLQLSDLGLHWILYRHFWVWFLMTFLTLGCDIAQISFSHTQYLGHWSGLNSVTFPLTCYQTHQTCPCVHTQIRMTLCLLTHPEALQLSSQPKTNTLIMKDYSDLYRIALLTLNILYTLSSLYQAFINRNLLL